MAEKVKSIRVRKRKMTESLLFRTNARNVSEKKNSLVGSAMSTSGN